MITRRQLPAPFAMSHCEPWDVGSQVVRADHVGTHLTEEAAGERFLRDWAALGSEPPDEPVCRAHRPNWEVVAQAAVVALGSARAGPLAWTRVAVRAFATRYGGLSAADLDEVAKLFEWPIEVTEEDGLHDGQHRRCARAA